MMHVYWGQIDTIPQSSGFFIKIIILARVLFVPKIKRTLIYVKIYVKNTIRTHNA